MSEALYLLGRIGHSTVALPADLVEAVLHIDHAVPVPGAPMAVRGLVSIRSRVLLLIDSAAVVGECADEPARYMAITSVDGHSYACTLDGLDDVITLGELQPVPVLMQAGWRSVAPQIADHLGEAVLVIDPARLVAAAGGDLALAA
jgi:purine-binding chemotaxis protein CheW